MRRYKVIELLKKETLLKIYIDNTDRYKDELLWTYLLQAIQDANLSGATVYKAVAGVGNHKTIHTFEILNLSNEMPLIIEVIENKEKILDFLKENRDALKGLFITLSDIETLSLS